MVCLQETHWNDGSAQLWRTLFPGTQLVSTPGRTGPNGSIQGGVAILVPHQLPVEEVRVLRQGSGIAAQLRNGQELFTCVSVHLPPDSGGRQSRMETLLALRDQELQRPVYLGADLNFQLQCQRNDEEVRLAAVANAMLADWGVVANASTGPTRTGYRGGSSSIDVVGVPAGEVHCTVVRSTWRRDLSDHAALVLSMGNAGRPALRCCPATMKALPQEALQDLRRGFARLQAQLDVAQLSFEPVSRGSAHLPQEGELPQGHEALLIVRDEPAPVADDEPRDEVVPPNPKLARHGRRAMEAMVNVWWKKWARRRPTDLVGPLRAVVAQHSTCTPCGGLADWLRTWGWEDGTLSPGRCEYWLSV